MEGARGSKSASAERQYQSEALEEPSERRTGTRTPSVDEESISSRRTNLPSLEARELKLARKELELERRELELERRELARERERSNPSLQGVPDGKADRMEGWLQDTERLGMTAPKRTAAAMATEDRRVHHPSTLVSSPDGYGTRVLQPSSSTMADNLRRWRPFDATMAASPPGYDHTVAIDQAAALDQEYADWRRAVDESLATHREAQRRQQEKYGEAATGERGVSFQMAKPLNVTLGDDILTVRQKAARKIVSRELPTFSGVPEQWPMFYASYQRSSAACGFDDQENLLRLQRALRGPALESVDHILLMPSGLQKALDILRSEYGRPGLIVESLIQKVRKMPAPRAESLETIAAFGKGVQKMCATIQISGLRQYDCDVALLDELAAKLPPERLLEWARYKVQLPEATVSEFGKWIGEIATAARLMVKVSKKGPILDRRESPNTRQAHVTVHTTEPSTSHGNILLRYVPVILYGNNKEVRTYALLDEGSTATFIEHSLIEELGVEGRPDPMSLRWTGGTTRQEVGSVRVALSISGVREGSKAFHLKIVHSVNDLSLPEQSVSMEELSARYTHLRGLPVASYYKARPRILIGVDNWGLGRPLKYAEGGSREPLATKTKLGWTVFGARGGSSRGEAVRSCYHVCICDGVSSDHLYNALKTHYAIESLGISSTKTVIPKENERANAILASETRLLDNRYQTALLWKYDDVRLPCNRNMALRRYTGLRKKMEKDPELANAITQKMKDYEAKGYIRRMNESEVAKREPRDWFLPIFPVFNVNKPGKLRMVFDAAAQVQGVSLNSFLLTGPDQLVGLVAVLYKFREFRVAVTGDIREMFFQVRMKPADQRSQLFFWDDGSSPNRPPNIYAVSVMTFGAACSPGSAHYVKNINADRFAERFPRASQCIKYEHYVDDMLSSVETEEEAVTLAEDVKHVHAQGGFEIRNWLSNSREVVKRLRSAANDQTSIEMCAEQGTEKVLGMWWNTEDDTFTFRLSPKNDQELLAGTKMPTKREVLRTLMVIYDPLGLIGHFLMFLKVLLQDLWRSRLGWDDTLEGDVAKKWLKWVAVLPDLQKTTVRRCYRELSSHSVNNIQLHIFCDASQSGMAAVAYLRFEENGIIECALVGSKTRVAPIKYLSIPRLELQAALIGARFARHIADEHRLSITKRIFWTDSRNVVSWIRSDHRRYSPFVAFRVSELIESTNTEEWHWLSTKLNVADDATKWQAIPEMGPSGRWFRGPEFIWQPEGEWPINNADVGETVEEARQVILHHTIDDYLVDFTRFSRWKTLLRTVGYVIRYVETLRRKVRQLEVPKGPLTQEELSTAERTIFIVVQMVEFGSDVKRMKNTTDRKYPWTKPLKRESKLYKLCPILDEHGVLRVHGRINHYLFDESLQRPVILPRRHHVTDLIVQDFHERYCHQNHRTVVNQLQAKFHIPKVRVEFNRVRRLCQWCKIRDAAPNPPIMGSIPFQRLAVSQRPFTYTGLDYFGPIHVTVGRRHEKRWGAIFTCLTTRAIHLEVVHTLTTASCILAIRRFVARRGSPREIISDQGTNFVGAARELREALKDVDTDALMERFSSPVMKWTFNPPSAPHFGGCWERLVQSVKKALSSLDLPKTPSDEQLISTLTEIELIINCRPLTYIPLEDEMDSPITPNHLLLGSSDGAKPEAFLDDSPAAVKASWCAAQRNAQLFWKKWTEDYLPTLTRRTKWFEPVKPIAVGDIVLIIDGNLPRSCYPKGRVIAIVQAKDGQVRRATVQTNSGTIERPATKIAVLDVKTRRD
ncbi:uncharacterized protein LOC125774271 [Anopheles funestus]|uniref:uncharacterized protein LOC125774271 n=1 Tax=Anopheles funestus TaxID=62324 RepID=UPI0020C65E19|nr:uncharacterized protein LOC125774271 [Anopheles funestus]